MNIEEAVRSVAHEVLDESGPINSPTRVDVFYTEDHYLEVSTQKGEILFEIEFRKGDLQKLVRGDDSVIGRLFMKRRG